LQSDAAITHDLDRYDDIYHFDPAINERLVMAACQGRYRVGPENVDELARELQAQVAAIRAPAGLAAVIDGPSRAGSPMK
jgi:hypothetical protein